MFWILACFLTQCKSKVETAVIPPKSLEKALVLCFHDVGRRGRYAIPLDEFREILDELKEFRVTSLSDWVEMKNPGDFRPRVVLTFDDGYKAHRDIVLPELMSRGYGATFFFYANQLKADKKWQLIAQKNLPGFEFGSHSWSHALMREMPYDDIFRELYLAREFMAHSLMREAPGFAWPYGYYEPAGLAAAKSAGFAYQVSVDYRVATRSDIESVIPRYTVFGRNAVKQVRDIVTDFRRASGKKPIR